MKRGLLALSRLLGCLQRREAPALRDSRLTRLLQGALDQVGILIHIFLLTAYDQRGGTPCKGVLDHVDHVARWSTMLHITTYTWYVSATQKLHERT